MLALAVALGAAVLYAQTHVPARPPSVPTASAVPLETALFLDPQDGVVLTRRGLLITHDRGQHWQLSLKLDWQGFNTVRFVDPQNIVVLSGPRGKRVLQATAVGGAHWTSSPIATVPTVGQDEVTFFLNAHEGWQQDTTYSGRGSYRSPTAIVISHSTDSGANWTEIARVDSEHPSSEGLRLDLTPAPSIVFTDPKRGFMNARSQDGVNKLYVTQDGGRTWQFAQFPAPPGDGVPGADALLSTPTMFGTRGIVALEVPGQPGSFTFTTVDGGLTWANPRPLPGRDDLTLGFADAAHWWGLSQQALYRTADAGQTWQLVPSKLPAVADRFVAVSAVSPQILWATVEGTLAAASKEGVPESACMPTMLGPACYFLIRSTDGGTTWTVVKLPAA